MLKLQVHGRFHPRVPHEDTLYSPDRYGDWKSYGPDKPLWKGCRYVDEDECYYDDEAGVPLDPHPALATGGNSAPDGTGATVLIPISFTVDNLNSSAGNIFFRVKLNGPSILISSFIEFDGTDIILVDFYGNNLRLPANDGVENIIAACWDAVESKMQLMVNGTWSAEENFSGIMHDGIFDLCRQDIYCVAVADDGCYAVADDNCLAIGDF